MTSRPRKATLEADQIAWGEPSDALFGTYKDTDLFCRAAAAPFRRRTINCANIDAETRRGN